MTFSLPLPPVLCRGTLYWANAVARNQRNWRNSSTPASAVNPVALAAQAKKFAVDTALWVIDQCVRIVGATGASAAHRLNMHFAEVRMAAYADGTNEMLLDRVGRGLSTTYPKSIP